jgi:UDP-N-acetylglucosamine 2-epimerase (non-hydrolysing)
MAPLVDALAGLGGVAQTLILTGQHDGLGRFFHSLPPERVHEIPQDMKARTPAKLRERLHRLLWPPLRRLRPELVLVHGDTSSALAGAMAARACGIPVGHVEAGLRSFDMRQPWPEEGNRIAIDALSELLFAPTEQAADNLRREWRVRGQIHVTGNTGIDALLRTRARLPFEPHLPMAEDRRLILVTCHRKENQGAPAQEVCRALIDLVRRLPVRVAFVLHPNPIVRGAMAALLAGEDHIRLLEPLDYRDMVRLLDRCWIVLTDSGGLQEEAPALGKPVLVLRNVTERPEALDSANLELVGTDGAAIVASVSALLADPGRLARMSQPAFPFGDGNAASRITAAIVRWLDARSGKRFMLRLGAGAPAAAPALRAHQPAVR